MVDIPRIIFSGMTKSLGKRAFSDSLLGKHARTVHEGQGMGISFLKKQ